MSSTDSFFQEVQLLILSATAFVRHGNWRQALPALKADYICSQYVGVMLLWNSKFQLALKCFTQALWIRTHIGSAQGQAGTRSPSEGLKKFGDISTSYPNRRFVWTGRCHIHSCGH